METQENLEYINIPKRKNLTEEDKQALLMLVEKQIYELEARGMNADRFRELREKIILSH